MTKASPAISAAALERMPKVTRTASQTTPRKVANSLGTIVVCCHGQQPTADAGDQGAQGGDDHLHLHDAHAGGPGARLAPADRVHGEAGGRPAEVHDEQRHDEEGHQAHVGEGAVGGGEARAVERQARARC